MRIQLGGVTVIVPERYPRYSPATQAAIARHVAAVQRRCRTVDRVWVSRVLQQDTDHPVIHGSYSYPTGKP